MKEKNLKKELKMIEKSMVIFNLVVVSVYELLLYTIKNKLLQSKRTNAELSDKMHQLFQDNNADYDKFKSWYGKDSFIKIGDKLEYEHYVIENFKKSVYGDSYAIKEYKPSY